MQQRSIAGYGWRPSLPRAGDAIYRPGAFSLPASMDLRSLCPPVYDQGELGSCTGNALAAAVQFCRHRECLSDFVPSRLFIYWCERQMEGTTGFDAGAQLRDGLEVLSLIGAPPETAWPYIEGNFAAMPTPETFSAAKLDRALQFMRVEQDLGSMRACLAEGFPFVFGFTVYEGFENPQVEQTGVLEMPAQGEAIVGAHAVLAVGYDDASQRFLVRNSWGSDWGQGGHFTMPYAYAADPGLAADFWTVRMLG